MMQSYILIRLSGRLSRSRFWVLGPRRTDGQDFFLSVLSGGLPMVNTKVFLFAFFFSRPFPAGCPGLIPWFFCFFFRSFPAGCPGLISGFFCFFFRLFPAGSLCMAEPASVYFKWRCPGLIPGFFCFFFRPFLAGSLCMVELASVYFKWCCPGLIPGFYLFLFFSAINRRSS